ncbi:conserved hypothetical protein [Ricinus communis]|uniref:Uncharacterized protein n=1 Tax=Ricinus communis TaxID=3988 RepID=B9T7K5_RICCO|nr:conserved hypothetical protein [Ricinus communis]
MQAKLRQCKVARACTSSNTQADGAAVGSHSSSAENAMCIVAAKEHHEPQGVEEPLSVGDAQPDIEPRGRESAIVLQKWVTFKQK